MKYVSLVNILQGSVYLLNKYEGIKLLNDFV